MYFLEAPDSIAAATDLGLSEPRWKANKWKDVLWAELIMGANWKARSQESAITRIKEEPTSGFVAVEGHAAAASHLATSLLPLLRCLIPRSPPPDVGLFPWHNALCCWLAGNRNPLYAALPSYWPLAPFLWKPQKSLARSSERGKEKQPRENICF